MTRLAMKPHASLLILPAFAALLLPVHVAAAEEPVRFRNEVMAVLSRVVRRLEVTPAEQYLIQPANQVTIKARAVFSDGSSKDVNGLAVFETTNPKVEVSRDGVVRSDMPAETTIVVRYLDRQATALLAFVPEHAGYRRSDPPAANYVD